MRSSSREVHLYTYNTSSVRTHYNCFFCLCFFLIPFVLSSPFFYVTQIQILGHIAEVISPPPDYGTCLAFDRDKGSALSSPVHSVGLLYIPVHDELLRMTDAAILTVVLHVVPLEPQSHQLIQVPYRT